MVLQLMLSAGKYFRIVLQVCVSFLPILFLFFIIFSLSFFHFCRTVSYIELNCYCSSDCQQLFSSWNLSLLTGKKLCIRVWIMITFFGKSVLHTHDPWGWKNFSVQSGDDSHVRSQIHHCRDQLCSRHQGYNTSPTVK
jgi:hypothetical protein